MARPREFEPEKALQVAIDVFWEKGYFDASVDEVVRRSGVAKYGIYGTFGTKDELFEKALRQYGRDGRTQFLAVLQQDGAALPELRAFFAGAVNKVMSRKNNRGCLMCNTAMEAGSISPEIQKIVNDFFAEMSKVIRGCLKRAVENKQLDPSKDSIEIATYLTNTLRMTLMLARSGESGRAIKQYVNVALSVLD
jgi:TetR/AcrR family transcriptional repressor of nem operon